MFEADLDMKSEDWILSSTSLIIDLYHFLNQSYIIYPSVLVPEKLVMISASRTVTGTHWYTGTASGTHRHFLSYQAHNQT